MKGGRGIYVPPGRRNKETTDHSPGGDVVEKKSTVVSSDTGVGREASRATDLTKERERPKVERGFYIPPGRRGQETKPPTGDNNEESLGKPLPPSDWDDETEDSHWGSNATKYEKATTSYPPAPSTEVYTPPDWTEIDHEFKDYISEEKLNSCCLVIDNYPSEASDIVRDNEINPYRRLNCEWKWINRQLCLLVFLNETIANRAIAAHTTTLHRPVTLDRYQTKHSNPALYQVARELYSLIKPERDSKVANRLINHALGLRPQRKPKETTKVLLPAKEEEVTTKDAWDD